MPAPLQTTGASSDSNAWQELENVFSALGQLARSSIAPTDFYRSLLDQSVQALSAVGGAVWLRDGSGGMQLAAQKSWPRTILGGDDERRRSHESLLNRAASDRHVVHVAPQSTEESDASANPSDFVLLLTPVHVYADQSPDGNAPRACAIIELLLPADASPSVYRGCEQFLTALCELAADYHAFNDLKHFREDERYRGELLRFALDANGQLNLTETAYAVVNEGRNIVGCDRLSVLVAHGRGCRLLATSGASRVERRSGAARRLAKLAELVRRTNEVALYSDGQCDALPPIAEALEEHAEESHARYVAAIPLQRHQSARTTDERHYSRRNQHSRPEFVLIAEQFDGRGLSRDRLVEAGEICSTGLYNAWEFDRLPLGWLTRPLAVVKHQVTAHLPRTLFVLAVIASAIAALFLVPAQFDVEASGSLEPIVKRDVFAPRSGIIEQVHVSHGTDVNAGDPLIQMRDPELELEIKRVDGELETVQRQLDAVRATRTNRTIRDEKPTEAYRLSAEERELQQRLANLRREIMLLNQERESLAVSAPISGRVITWDVSNRLTTRPVERGEVLLKIADLDEDWQLELDVPDDRFGYVLAAQQSIQADLPVEFRLNSDDRERHLGHIREISQTATVDETAGTSAVPSVIVHVAIDQLALDKLARRELRPGVTARAQISCGRAPLGYVWLHDIWDAIVEWITF